MSADPRIQRLLEELLDSGSSPEIVTRECPELLPQLLAALRHLRAVEAEVAALFPETGDTPEPSIGASVTTSELPRIPGYEIESVLGRGGMGVVYQARHLRLNRTVGVKMLLAGASATEIERERFMREAEAAARLQHPNIVQVHDVGDHDGRMYFTMEFVAGGTLADQLAGVPQPPRNAAEMLAVLTDAVCAAHLSRIVHRDLKPSNVLLTADGVPKISDFGLARRMEGAPALTLTGAPMGTPSYMSPEQARGDSSALGPLVDVYAMGALLYVSLTGRPPFRADSSSATLQQVISQEPVPPSKLNASIPRDLETICLKCLNKEPGGRYATAADLRDDVRRFLANEPIVARPIGLLGRGLRWARRNPAAAALLLTVAGLLAVTTLFGMKEIALASERRRERAALAERLQFVLQLEHQGRFREARAILARVPDGDSGALRGEVDAAIEDLNVAEKLEQARMSRGQFKPGGGFDYDASSRQYATIFREAGFGTIQDDPAEVAKRLRNSTAKQALLAALDDWAVCARDKPREWIFRVARAMDSDPWRDRVRSQKCWGSKSELEQLAREVNVAEQPVTLMVAMATRLRLLDGDSTEFLQRIYTVHPNDFWLNFELGFLFGLRDDPVAAGYNRAALALRPGTPAVHFNLGMNQFRLGRHDEAIHHLRSAANAEPKHTWAHFNLAELLLAKGQLDDAYHHFQCASELEPESRAPRNRLREILIRQGHVDQAAADWAKVFYSDAPSFDECEGYPEFCLIRGREAEYRRACARFLKRFGDTVDPRECECLGRACLLGPLPQEQRSQGVAIVDRALAADKSTYADWLYPYFRFAKGLAEHRTGQYESAIAICEGDAAGVLGPAPELVTALAQHQLGNHEAARQALAKSEEEFDGQGDAVRHREDWMYHLLRREAVNLIEK